MSKLTGGEGADMKVGYQLGVGMEYAFTDMWSVQPSMIVGNGAKFDYGGGESEKFKPTYLQIPIMAAGRFPVTESINIVGKVGPYLGFGLGGKCDGEKIFKYDEDTGEGWDAKRFDFGLGFGVGRIRQVSGRPGLPVRSDGSDGLGQRFSEEYVYRSLGRLQILITET